MKDMGGDANAGSTECNRCHQDGRPVVEWIEQCHGGDAQYERDTDAEGCNPNAGADRAAQLVDRGLQPHYKQ